MPFQLPTSLVPQRRDPFGHVRLLPEGLESIPTPPVNLPTPQRSRLPARPRYDEYVRELGEGAPPLPRLLPKQGPGAFEHEGEVHKPGLIRSLLGALSTGMTRSRSGAEAAEAHKRRTFYGGYERALGETERGREARATRLEELRPLMDLEDRMTRGREAAQRPFAVSSGLYHPGSEGLPGRFERTALPPQERVQIPGRDIELPKSVEAQRIRITKQSRAPAAKLPGRDVPLPKDVEAQKIRLTRRGLLGVGSVPVSPLGTSPEDILGKYPPEIQQKARMLSEYKVPATGYMLSRSPEWAMAAEAASEMDPTWNAAEYPSRLKLLNDFKSGKAAANVRSLNTLIGHLDSMNKTALKLDNRSLQMWNSLANRLITEVGDPRVTNFEKTVIAVQNEAATLFKGTGATDQEIKEWRATINSSQSPEQLIDGILQMVDLMSSRLSALQEQYNTGMGKPIDFKLLTDKSSGILEGLGVGDLEQGIGEARVGGQGTITVMSPDGQRGTIPAEDWPAAEAEGYRRVQ